MLSLREGVFLQLPFLKRNCLIIEFLQISRDFFIIIITEFIVNKHLKIKEQKQWVVILWRLLQNEFFFNNKTLIQEGIWLRIKFPETASHLNSLFKIVKTLGRVVVIVNKWGITQIWNTLHLWCSMFFSFNVVVETTDFKITFLRCKK